MSKASDPVTPDRMKEIRERAEKQFNCSRCAGSGRSMVGALKSDACYRCGGTGCIDVTVNEIIAFAQSEREAAERETLEKAAKLCEQEAEDSKLKWYGGLLVQCCNKLAAAIRELARGKGGADGKD